MALLFDLNPLLLLDRTGNRSCGASRCCRGPGIDRRSRWSDEGWDFLQDRLLAHQMAESQVPHDCNLGSDVFQECLTGLTQGLSGCQNRTAESVSVFDVLQDGFARVVQPELNPQETKDLSGFDVLQDGFTRLVQEFTKPRDDLQGDSTQPKTQDSKSEANSASESADPKVSPDRPASIFDLLQSNLSRFAENMSKSQAPEGCSSASSQPKTQDPKTEINRESESTDPKENSDRPVSMFDLLQDNFSRLAETMSKSEGSEGYPADLFDVLQGGLAGLAQGLPGAQNPNEVPNPVVDILREGFAKLEEKLSNPQNPKDCPASFCDVLQDGLAGLAQDLKTPQDPKEDPLSGLDILQGGLSKLFKDLAKPQPHKPSPMSECDLLAAGPSSQTMSEPRGSTSSLVSVPVERDQAKDLRWKELSMDVRGFSPDEIRVKIKDRTVTVEAKHEEGHQDSGNYVLKEVRRQFTLPEDVDVNAVTCEMSPEGLLYLCTPGLSKKAIEVTRSEDVTEEPATLEKTVTSTDNLD